MEAKSLYTILGIRPDASPDQIETAYAELLHYLKDGSEANPGGDDRIRFIAAKEAYTVLSNPISRQQYNQKLLAPSTLDSAPEIIVMPSSSWSIFKMLVAGAIVIGAVWTYNYNSIEKEKLRAQHEKEMQENQISLEQEQLTEKKRVEDAERDRLLRERALQESRELDIRLQQYAREQEMKQQQVAREQQYRQQQEEARRRQQQYEAERQIEREKQALQRLQNENRRNGYRYY